MFYRMMVLPFALCHGGAVRTWCLVLLAALAHLGLPARALSQPTPREIRVEVRDREGRMLPGARVDFLPGTDTAMTDSAGIAIATVQAESTLTISVRKLGFEPRAARFPIGTAPAFRVRVMLGALGVRLAEVSVTADYPGEPWRSGYEERKRRASGSFRDRSFFSGPRQPQLLSDWFNGLPGTQLTSQGLRINRCPRVGVWIDGMHMTRSRVPANITLQQLTAPDIAAIEIYRTAQQQAQFSDPNNEDCSVVVWTRSR